MTTLIMIILIIIIIMIILIILIIIMIIITFFISLLKVHIKYYMGLLKQTSESVKLTKRAKINFLCLSIVNS